MRPLALSLAAIALAGCSTTRAAAQQQPSATETTAITLGDTITVSGSGATVDGNTLTITSAGAYRLSGSLADGQVIVAAPDSADVQLILDGVSLRSSTSAPLYIMSADSVQLILADGSQNSLADGAARAKNAAGSDEPDAALFSAADLVISGSGALTVDGRYQDGIASKDYLDILSGNVSVTSVDDAIRGRDRLVVSGGALTVNAGADGLKSTNDEDPTRGFLSIDGGTLNVTAGDDGIKAETTLTINGGDISILDSYEGLEGQQITINDGRVQLRSRDDGINVANAVSGTPRLTINGGSVVVDSTGDGLDANGFIDMTGGVVVVYGPSVNMNGALDYDRTFNISGGWLIAAGSSGMAQAPGTGSSQASVLVNLPGALPAGTAVQIVSSNGSAIASITPNRTFQSLVVSSPDLTNGQTYLVYAADTQAASFTVAGPVTTEGSAGGMRGGFPRGPRP